jgi:hypothetical protein
MLVLCACCACLWFLAPRPHQQLQLDCCVQTTEATPKDANTRPAIAAIYCGAAAERACVDCCCACRQKQQAEQERRLHVCANRFTLTLHAAVVCMTAQSMCTQMPPGSMQKEHATPGNGTLDVPVAVPLPADAEV